MEVVVNVHAGLTTTSELSVLAEYFVDVAGNTLTTTSIQLQPKIIRGDEDYSARQLHHAHNHSSGRRRA